MARISSGEEFGQRVAQPTRFNEVATPRAAFGSTDALAAEGQRLEREGIQQQRELKHEEQQVLSAREAADRAQASMHLGALRDRVADVVGEIDEGVQNGSIDKTKARQEWEERTARAVEDGLPNIPEAHRGRAQMDLDLLRQRFSSKVDGVVQKRDQADTLAGISGTLEYAQRLAVEKPDVARQVAMDALDQLGPHAGLAPDKITKAKQAWVEGAAYTRAFTALNAAKHDNGALGTVESAIAGNKDLDPQRQAQLLAQADNYRAANEARALRAAQHAEIVAARRERESTSAFNVLAGWAMDGKAANPDAAAPLLKKMTPDHLAAYKAMSAEIPARAALAMQPLQQQEVRLAALQSKAITDGTSVALEAEIKRTQHVVTEAKRDYAAEPLKAAAERGVIDPVQPLNMTSIDTMVGGLAARVEQAQMVSTITRKPESPFLAEEAAKFAMVLSHLPPSQRASGIAQLSQLLPPGMAQAVAKQIDTKDRALALQMAVGTAATTEGRMTSELIGRGAQAVKDKGIKEDTAAQTGLRATLAAAVGDKLPGRWREDVIDAARLITLGEQANGGSIDAERAVRLAMGGEFVERNGQTLPVPAGVDLDDHLRFNVSPDDLLPQAPDGVAYLPNGQPLSLRGLVQGLPHAQLEPVGLGRYAIRSGGGLVVNAQRRPIVVGVK